MKTTLQPPTQKHPTVVVSVRMTADLHRTLADLAAAEGRSLNRQIVRLLETALRPAAARPRRASARRRP